MQSQGPFKYREGRQKSHRVRSEDATAGFEDAGKGQEPRKGSSLKEHEKERKRSPLESPEEQP